MSDKFEIIALIRQLNEATEQYDAGHPIMSDKEWDDLYFELKMKETETGIVFPNSPTQNIHFTKVSELKKVKHNHPMLSLDKTKNFDDIKTFLDTFPWIAMAKLDGLTCSLKYVNGKLVSAETRGNGIEGEDVTHNAKVIASIPQNINYKNELIIDGEIICTYKDFEQFKTLYKNPRNFASGSIRLLDSKECQKRCLTFVAWDCFCDDNFYDKYLNKPYNIQKTLSLKLQILEDLGFIIVPNIVDADVDLIDKTIDIIKEKSTPYPIDGIVFKYDDVDDYNAAGRTDHHFKGGLAYKFYDETYETKLVNIEWSMSRLGQLSPIAVFETLNIDGTEISKASLSNLTIMRKTLGKHPFKGQILEISKRNQIIPKVERARGEDGKWII